MVVSCCQLKCWVECLCLLGVRCEGPAGEALIVAYGTVTLLIVTNLFCSLQWWGTGAGSQNRPVHPSLRNGTKGRCSCASRPPFLPPCEWWWWSEWVEDRWMTSSMRMCGSPVISFNTNINFLLKERLSAHHNTQPASSSSTTVTIHAFVLGSSPFAVIRLSSAVW